MAIPIRRQRDANEPISIRIERHEVLVLVFLLTHVLLGFLIVYSRIDSTVSTLHAFGILIVALILCVTRAPLERLLFMSFYIIGSEVLWRMTRANVPWEFAKYSIVLLLGIYQFDRRRRILPIFAVLYFVCQLPSALLTTDLGSKMWAEFSSILSGPLTLVITATLLASNRINAKQLKWMLISLIGPALTIAAITFLRVIAANHIVFTLESNSMTSGGFGPNQVSTALGIGFLATWLMLINFNVSKIIFVALSASGIWLLAQAVLTFSRGGVINALVAGVVGALLVQINRNGGASRRMTTIWAVLIFLVAFNAFLPQIDEFTGGLFRQRYQSLDLTNRDSIISTDFEMFTRFPFTGVGVGMSKYYRVQYFDEENAAHTEYTRILAEHGVLGVFALIFLGVICLANVASVWNNPTARPIVIALLVWALLYMAHAAMRTAAPAFFIGFTFLQYESGTST